MIELRARICTVAALVSAIAELSMKLPPSKEVEQLQCLAEAAERYADDALNRISRLIESPASKSA